MQSVLNACFDALPRPWVGQLSRRAPTFRTCGVTGFHFAVLTVVLAALITGRSVWVAVLLALVSAASFFAYAYARMRVTGREELVLLEHVWVAELVAVGTLVALDLPLLEGLDLLAVALCPFLGWGRVGCTLVGCCHGKPSDVGLRYGSECVDAGFPAHLAGVRLFPVQIVEMLGLWTIGLVGMGLLLIAPVGGALIWFLVSYAVMRFGLEELRGDRRPYWLGLSQAQWMSIVEICVALGLAGSPFVRAAPAASVATVALGALALGAGVFVRARAARRRARLATGEGVRETVRQQLSSEVAVPALGWTAHGVGVASSRLQDGSYHVSLSLPAPQHDLQLLCEIASAALPESDPDKTGTTDGRILHLNVVRLADDEPRAADPRRARVLYGHAVRAALAPMEAAPAAEPEPRPEDVREDYFGARGA